MSIGSIATRTRSSGTEETLFFYELSQRALIELSPSATRAVKSANLLQPPVTEDTFLQVVAHALTLPAQGTVLPVAGLERQTILDRLFDPHDTGFREAFAELTTFGTMWWSQRPSQSLVAHRTYRGSSGEEAALVVVLRGINGERHVLDLGTKGWAAARPFLASRSNPSIDELAQLKASLKVEWMDRPELTARLADPQFAQAYVSATATRDPRWPPVPP